MELVLNCRQCGGPLASHERSHAKSDDSGVRLDKSLWLAHLEADPFCSAECARQFHGAEPTQLERPRCPGCNVVLAHNRMRSAGPYCTPCVRAEQVRRYFFDPGVCAHCGIESSAYTSGCWTCNNRRNQRTRRAAAKSSPRPPVSQASARADVQTVPGATTSMEVAA